MFKTFTWGQYAGLVFVLLAAYYLFVAAAYYRVEILALLKGKGRGGAAPAVAVAARQSLVGGSGSLIPKTALAIQSDAADEEEEAGKPAATRPKENEDDEVVLDEVKINEPNIDNIDKLNHEEDADDLPGPQATDSEADFTVGVAQLADYLEDAAEGNITQEELVAQLPELDNSALLVAFFQSNAKAAQQLTSQYYVDVPEPVLD
ncbi:MAG: hypothetical protein ACRYG7_07570 [Janthinobacterium lividum]